MIKGESILTRWRSRKQKAIDRRNPDRKGKGDGSARLVIKMTENPATYDIINVEITQVSVHYGKNSSICGWIDLGMGPDVYNLERIKDRDPRMPTNETMIPAGHITRMRLGLREVNNVVVGGVSFDLQAPSSQHPGLVIDLNTEIEEGHVYEVVLDFDTERSADEQGQGSYLLSPIIKMESINKIS